MVIIPVAAPFKGYAQEVQQQLHDQGLFAEVDMTDNTLNKKIRNAQVAQWNFIMGMSLYSLTVIRHSGQKLQVLHADIAVVGEVEAETKSVNIRNRDDEVQGREETVTVADAVQKLVALKKSRASDNKL